MKLTKYFSFIALFAVSLMLSTFAFAGGATERAESPNMQTESGKILLIIDTPSTSRQIARILAEKTNLSNGVIVVNAQDFESIAETKEQTSVPKIEMILNVTRSERLQIPYLTPEKMAHFSYKPKQKIFRR